MSKTNKILALAIALGLCLGAPAAMAQVKLGGAARADTPVAQAQVGAHVHAQTATPATPATPAIPATPPVRSDTGMTPAVPATPATPATPAQPAQKSWTQLDVNANGTLSATEAAGIPQLEKIFVQADANADGELSADEYKAWLAASGKGKAKVAPASGG